VRVEFRLPDVGEGLEEGEIVSWLVAPGDTVTRDQPLVEVQTDKALVELPSPVAGRVVSLAFDPGALVKVGQVLVVLEDGDAAQPGQPQAPAPVPAPAARPQAPAPVAAPTARPKAAPAVRKMALERGVDLATVTGMGPGGRILAADVEAAAQRAARSGVAESAIPRLKDARTEEVPALGQLAPGRHPLRGIRRVTAETMTRSWREIPHLTVMDELDASALLDARQQLGEDLSLVAFLVAAVAGALRRYPIVNASLEAGEVVVHEECHVGLAVATPAGLVVPVLRDADRRSLGQLSSEVRRLTSLAREGKVELADLRQGTFTLSNYGSLGGRFSTPIIRPPEVGIIGFGSIRPRPLVVGGDVVARPTLPYCLSVDHRLIDGDVATAFVEDIAATLAAPIRLFRET
jgi:pyruvate/2-oxoglutarate dehydrogenase complex dihydrolipoamide acyltransferase (E2) component